MIAHLPLAVNKQMALVLKQVRRCDGACCKESPRFPNERGNDCIFHKSRVGKESSGCMLMTGEMTLSNERVVAYVGRDAQSVFEETCEAWPQRNSTVEVGDTGGCCWQYVDNAN